MRIDPAKSILIALVVGLVCRPQAVGAGSMPAEAASAVAAYHKTQLAHPRRLLGSTVSGLFLVKFARGANHSRTFRIDAFSLRDGLRFDIRTRRWDDGKAARGWRTIVDGSLITYPAPPPGKQAISGYYVQDGARNVGAAVPSGLSAFDGYVAGDFVNVMEIIAGAAEVNTSHETIDGHDCVLVQFDSPAHGAYQLWLDPAIGYYPRKIAVLKSDKNFWAGIPLNQWSKFTPNGSRGYVTVRSRSYVMDEAHFDQVEGDWCPLSCRVTEVVTYSDGNCESTVMQCKRTAVDFDPDFATARAFTPELRNGARLANQTDQHLPFQWTDHGPMPAVDAKTLQSMDQAADVLKKDLGHAGGGGAR